MGLVCYCQLTTSVTPQVCQLCHKLLKNADPGSFIFVKGEIGNDLASQYIVVQAVWGVWVVATYYNGS